MKESYMGEFTNIILALAVILYGTFISMAGKSLISLQQGIIQNEIQLSALAEAEAIINNAWSKEFDEQCVSLDIAIDDTTGFTLPALLGVEGAESSDSIRHFDDLDDFNDPYNNFKSYDTVAVTMDYRGNQEIFYKYILKTKVFYVTANGQYSMSRTPHKKLIVLIDIIDGNIPDKTEITIDGNGTIQNEPWNIMLSKTFTYSGPDYHGL